MAVLDKIRSNAVLIVGFLGLALFAFIVGDALQQGSTFWQKNQEVVLSIDGEEVSIHDYQDRLREMEQMAQERIGAQPSDEQRMMINNQLTQEYITDYALSKIAADLGLKVTPDEFYALLIGDKGIATSPIAMQFFSSMGINPSDAKAVNDFISQMSDRQIEAQPENIRPQMAMLQSRWMSVQKAIVNTRLQQKLESLLRRSYKITDLDREVVLADGSRSVALVRTTPSPVTDSLSRATDEEIKKYYEEHKNYFRMQSPSTELSFISVQVTPSTEDYKAAELSKNDALAALVLANTTKEVEDLMRTFHGQKFFRPTYLTGAELDQLAQAGVGDEEISFIKDAQIGQVNAPQLVNDRYNLVKLVNKKNGAESINVRLIALDSLKATQIDSIRTLLTSGKDFATLASEISIDPSTSTNGGLITFPSQFGGLDSAITEFGAAQMGLDTLYKAPFGQVITIDRGNNKFLVKAVNPKPAVEKYQVAFVAIPAEFSDKTFDSRYQAMNTILNEGGSFEDMEKKAFKEGFNVSRDVAVAAETAQLSFIPSSRQVVSWGINAKEGDMTDKVFRCSSDYLVIAKVGKHLEAGFAPLSMVREQIIAEVEAKKRTERFAETLASKGLNTLEAYAAELSAQVDTLVGVNYIVRGSEGAAFNAKAMTTAIGSVSKPFAARTEVMIVQPLSKEPLNPEVAKSQAAQQQAALSNQISRRAFIDFVQSLKVTDNRARFF